MKLIFSLLLAASVWSGGAEGKNFGSIYTQLTYSPIITSTYTDASGEQVDTEQYQRHQAENYGEIGIWNTTTTFVWNLKWMTHEFEGKSHTGLANTQLGIQHQFYEGNFRLASGLSVDLPAPDNQPIALSQEDPIYTYSQFFSLQKLQANLHILTDGEDQALALDLRYTWNPTSGLYLSAAFRGQKTFKDLNTSPNQFGYGLDAEYISPGVEAFYSISNSIHLVGALYGGALMRNIYAFPGIKMGFAWTLG